MGHNGNDLVCRYAVLGRSSVFLGVRRSDSSRVECVEKGLVGAGAGSKCIWGRGGYKEDFASPIVGFWEITPS